MPILVTKSAPSSFTWPHISSAIISSTPTHNTLFFFSKSLLLTGRLPCLHMHDCCVRGERGMSPPSNRKQPAHIQSLPLPLSPVNLPVHPFALYINSLFVHFVPRLLITQLVSVFFYVTTATTYKPYSSCCLPPRTKLWNQQPLKRWSFLIR
jgi:hypothetical protein